MKYIVIGTHGLFNKPEPEILKDGWQKAIIEGLKKNQDVNAEDINFEMLYWADLMYNTYDDEAKLYKEAKKDSLKEYKENWIDSARAFTQSVVDTPLEYMKSAFDIDLLINGVLKIMYEDLYRYYQEKDKKKEVRQRFIDTFTTHKDKKIIFVAHSMGSIVAYESLLKLSELEPSIQIEHFITIGSPLGLPHVKYNIYEEFKKTVTPENVKKWSNFSDKRDLVALDTHIRDDYGPNANTIRVEDDLIINDWEGNAHKSYGYLRAPEFSKAIKLTLRGEL